MIYYHRTAVAERILAHGFRDYTGSYGLDGATRTGVFLSDVPPDEDEGAAGEDLLQVTLPGELDISEYEIVEEGLGYREWCVPAALLNEHSYIRRLSPDEVGQGTS